MKKVLLALTVVLLTSCYPHKFATYSILLDYTPYTTDGFFLTESNSVNFEYFPMGSINSVALSGYMKNNKYRYAKPEDALQELVKKGTLIHANGVMNIKVRPIFDKKGEYIIGYDISGMAIKIIPKN